MLQNTNLFSLMIKVVLLHLLLSSCQQAKKSPITVWQHAVEGSYAADISNDGKYSIVSTIHHGMGLWDLEKNALKFTWSQQLNNADNLVLLLDIADNNSHAMTANRYDFSIWNITTGASEGFWAIKDGTIRDIALANNAQYALIGKSNNKVTHVNLKTGRRLEFLGHSEKINSVDMLPNGRVAISGGNDFVVYVWNTKTGQVIYRFNHQSRITMVSLDAKARYAFTADSQKSANIWDLATGKRISSLQYSNRQEIFSSIRFSPNGKTLLTGSPSGKISVWSISTGQRLASWFAYPKKNIRPASVVIYSVAYQDDEHIITESSSGYAELWKIKE